MVQGTSGAILLTIILSFYGNASALDTVGSLRARKSMQAPEKKDKNQNESESPDAKNQKESESSDATSSTTEEDTLEESDDGVEVSWSPVVALVQSSLEDTEAQRATVQEKLRVLRKGCDVQVAACDQEVEETAANLRRLTIAVAQLRQMRQNDAEKIEENEKRRAVQEVTVERDIEDLVAVQQFARLSKEDADAQAKHYNDLSEAYGKKISDAQEAITKTQAKLEKARDQEREADGSAVGFTSDAMAISDGVNATDAFVEEEVMEAQRKEHSASALFKKAQGMATRAAGMLRYHKASTAPAEEEEFEEMPMTESENVKGGQSEKEDPCPPHHSEMGDSFIQKPCAAKDDFINEAEAAAQRARKKAMKEAASDDDTASEDDFDNAEDEE